MGDTETPKKGKKSSKGATSTASSAEDEPEDPTMPDSFAAFAQLVTPSGGWKSIESSSEAKLGWDKRTLEGWYQFQMNVDATLENEKGELLVEGKLTQAISHLIQVAVNDGMNFFITITSGHVDAALHGKKRVHELLKTKLSGQEANGAVTHKAKQMILVPHVLSYLLMKGPTPWAVKAGLNPRTLPLALTAGDITKSSRDVATLVSGCFDDWLNTRFSVWARLSDKSKEDLRELANFINMALAAQPDLMEIGEKWDICAQLSKGDAMGQFKVGSKEKMTPKVLLAQLMSKYTLGADGKKAKKEN
jgi:hypothetical protein